MTGVSNTEYCSSVGSGTGEMNHDEPFLQKGDRTFDAPEVPRNCWPGTFGDISLQTRSFV